MRIRQFFLATTVLCATAFSQTTNPNIIEMWPGKTGFASRAYIGASGGELHQGFHASAWRGIGHDGVGTCKIVSVGTGLQDEDDKTSEKFYWRIRGGTDTAGPNTQSTGVIATIGPFNTPTGTGGQSAYLLTTSLATPVKVPCTGFFSVGVQFSPTPLWFKDGLSVHCSKQTEQKSHAKQEDHAWYFLDGAKTAAHPSDKRTCHMRFGVHSPTLQLGNGTITVGTKTHGVYGMGGMFPASGVPWTARVEYGPSIGGGTSLLYASTARTGGFSLFPGTTPLFLGGVFTFLHGATTNASGDVVHNTVPAVPAAAAGIGTFYVQAAGAKGAIVLLTNAQTITP